MDDRGGSFVAVRRISQGLERGNNTCNSTSGNLVLIPFLSLLMCCRYCIYIFFNIGSVA